MTLVEQKSEFETLRDLVREAFPDLRCLRCGSDDFFLKGMLDNLGTGEFIEGKPLSSTQDYEQALRLVCQRCGFVEHHSVQVLQDAAKPIRKK
jgi:predicted nucleic-acid-binding Zn-ribbon protein